MAIAMFTVAITNERANWLRPVSDNVRSVVVRIIPVIARGFKSG